MHYNENITIEMKTTLFGKPGIKSLDTEATISPLGDEMQFDLNLKNRDLLHRKFTIDENRIIRHGRNNYRCTATLLQKDVLTMLLSLLSLWANIFSYELPH